MFNVHGTVKKGHGAVCVGHADRVCVGVRVCECVSVRDSLCAMGDFDFIGSIFYFEV